MKQTFLISAFALFCLFSCAEQMQTDSTTEKDSDSTEKSTETARRGVSGIDTIQEQNAADENEVQHYQKEMDLFWIRDMEESANKKVGFVSLSDVYSWSDDPAVQPISDLASRDKNSAHDFKLNTSDRKRFLTGTIFTENDSVFIYDYATDVLHAFSVKKLNVVAFLNDYMNAEECPCSASDYMIGFEIAKNQLPGLGNYYSDALVFVGKENPFVKGGMKAIVWQKIKTEKFPSSKSTLTESQNAYRHKDAVKSQAYVYETNAEQIFIQDYSESSNPIHVLDRHLLILDKQSGKVLHEKLFSNDEGSSVTPLNFGINNPNYPDLKEQWVGKLFKDKPEVIFGFTWVSFGCPAIFFVHSPNKYAEINCDNRH